jgi:hypothetical protein
MRPHGRREEACVALKEIQKSSCSGARLSVNTEQLLTGGIDIDVFDQEGQLLASAEGATYKFLTVRDLCAGLRFGPGKFTGKKRVELISFYLDELTHRAQRRAPKSTPAPTLAPRLLEALPHRRGQRRRIIREPAERLAQQHHPLHRGQRLIQQQHRLAPD